MLLPSVAWLIAVVRRSRVGGSDNQSNRRLKCSVGRVSVKSVCLLVTPPHAGSTTTVHRHAGYVPPPPGDANPADPPTCASI